MGEKTVPSYPWPDFPAVVNRYSTINKVHNPILKPVPSSKTYNIIECDQQSDSVHHYHTGSNSTRVADCAYSKDQCIVNKKVKYVISTQSNL